MVGQPGIQLSSQPLQKGMFQGPKYADETLQTTKMPPRKIKFRKAALSFQTTETPQRHLPVWVLVCISMTGIAGLTYMFWNKVPSFAQGDNSFRLASQPSYTFPYSILMVENTRHPLLKSVIGLALVNTPRGWPLQLFTNNDTAQVLLQDPVMEAYRRAGRIIYTPINPRYDAKPLLRDAILTDPYFWRAVRGKKVLYMTLETIMCSNSAASIKDFLEYDWVGAPWVQEPHAGAGKVGSGSISLRNRDLMLKVLASSKPEKGMREDVFFVTQLRKLGASFPSDNKAKEFAVESVFHDAPIACGRAVKFLPAADFKRLHVHCLESKMLYPWTDLPPEYEIHDEL
jgi:hypothetical protein